MCSHDNCAWGGNYVSTVIPNVNGGSRILKYAPFDDAHVNCLDRDEKDMNVHVPSEYGEMRKPLFHGKFSLNNDNFQYWHAKTHARLRMLVYWLWQHSFILCILFLLVIYYLSQKNMM